jgi:hypothetical protein
MAIDYVVGKTPIKITHLVIPQGLYDTLVADIHLTTDGKLSDLKVNTILFDVFKKLNIKIVPDNFYIDLK